MAGTEATTRSPGVDVVELIGDEPAETGEAGAVANPRSLLGAAEREALRALLGDGVRFDEPMRRHTTLKIGGPADAFAEPARAAELAALARWCAMRGTRTWCTCRGARTWRPRWRTRRGRGIS